MDNQKDNMKQDTSNKAGGEESNSLDYLKVYREEVDESVKKVKERISNEIKTREYIEFHKYILEKTKEEILNKIISGLDLPLESKNEINIDFPPSHIEGDLTLSAFEISKKIKKDPKLIAEQIVTLLKEGDVFMVKEVKLMGPYINIELNKEVFYKESLRQMTDLGLKYGDSDVNAKKIAIFDYSAPNIAKPIGVGHLRSTIIGQSLINIYRKTGYSTIGDNHLGDWGTQFGELIYAYQKWGDEEKIKKDPIGELKNLYVKFHSISEDNPELQEEARNLFQKLEEHEPVITKLWKEFVDISIGDFKKTYKRLGVDFDLWIGEGYFSDGALEAIQDCLDKGLCRREEGSKIVIVDEQDGLPSFLLQKQDGSTLYISRDLATLKYRVKTFNPNSIVYVVGGEQELHFKQLFALSRRMGYLSDNIEVRHTGFGMVLVEGKKMSTRRGTTIELEDLLTRSVQKSKDLLLSRNKDLSSEEIEKISEIIGVGAIIYNDLKQDRVNNISFDWDRMLNLEGESSVYLQYTYTRIQSMLRKVYELKGKNLKEVCKQIELKFESPIEFELIKKMSCFPDIVFKSQKENGPHIIAGYLEELAQLFNNFYNGVQVIQTIDNNLLESRILLVENVGGMIKEGLALLNIGVPEKM